MEGNQKESLRILILITQLEYGGAQKVALTLARYFYRKGNHVVLCFFYDKYGLVEEVRRQESFPILDLGAKIPESHWLINGIRAIRALVRLFFFMRQQRFQIILTLTHYSNVLGIPIAWMSRVPVRISSQRNTLIAFPNWFLRLDSWIVNSPMVDVMLTVSEQTRRFCVDSEGMKSQKLVTVSNGINVNEFQQDRSIDELIDLRHKFGIPRNGCVMTTIARLHPQKGHSFLIDAASLVLESHPDAIFLLIGDGESRNDIEDRIQYLDLTPHFRLIGLSSNIRQLLALSELFVLPSLYEGMPNVILEAMATKLAVVATDVGGTRELVVHGETGLLVPAADPKALGNAIISLLNDPVTRLSMGGRGHERVKTHFSEQVMCQRYEKLMRSLIDQKGNK